MERIRNRRPRAGHRLHLRRRLWLTHPFAIQQDAGVPRDLMEARLDAVITAIQKTLRTGTV